MRIFAFLQCTDCHLHSRDFNKSDPHTWQRQMIMNSQSHFGDFLFSPRWQMFVVIKFNLQPETHSDEFISQSLIGNYASEVFNVLKVRVFFQIIFRFRNKLKFSVVCQDYADWLWNHNNLMQSQRDQRLGEELQRSKRQHSVNLVRLVKDSFNSSLLLGGPVHLVVGGVHWFHNILEEIKNGS